MSNRKRFLTGFCLLVLLAAFVHGQSINAKMFGNVKNEDGKYLSAVLVTATNVKNNAETTTSTGGKKGAFRFLSLAPGLYQVSFDIEGYQPLILSGIQLNAEQSVTLRVKLKKME